MKELGLGRAHRVAGTPGLHPSRPGARVSTHDDTDDDRIDAPSVAGASPWPPQVDRSGAARSSGRARAPTAARTLGRAALHRPRSDGRDAAATLKTPGGHRLHGARDPAADAARRRAACQDAGPRHRQRAPRRGRRPRARVSRVHHAGEGARRALSRRALRAASRAAHRSRGLRGSWPSRLARMSEQVSARGAAALPTTITRSSSGRIATAHGGWTC